MPTDLHINAAFPRYKDHDPHVPIWNLTPDLSGCIVRFFDTPAISPSGRYMACFRLPFEDHTPLPGDAGEIVLVDLHEGGHRIIATTCGWEPQVGAQVNWGASDDALLFSDVDTTTWLPHTVKLNPLTGDRVILNGPIYNVSRDGRWIIGTNPRLMQRTQLGYGVIVPEQHVPVRRGAPADDGVWLTDTTTGQCKLLHSLADVVSRFADELGVQRAGDYEIIAFHSKFAPSGDKLLFTLRYFNADYTRPPDPIANVAGSGLRFAILTSNLDGSDLQLAIGPDAWRHGGHHINFFPDGKRLSMNLGGFAEPPRELRFVQCDTRGGELTPILTDVIGGGHPSVHPNGTHILTDCYFRERWTYDDGTTPLRWVDLRNGQVRDIARICTRSPSDNGALRIDPHPCWDFSWQYATFTAIEGNTRRVFLADMRSLLQG